MDEKNIELSERLKSLRIEHKVEIEYAAALLGMSIQEYMRFEGGEADPDADYFRLSLLSFLYGVDLDYMFGRDPNRGKETVCVMDETYNFNALAQRKHFAFEAAAAELVVISEAEYEALAENEKLAKCIYIDDRGAVITVVLGENGAGVTGYYFVSINGAAEIAYFNSDGGYYEANGRRYPAKFTDTDILARMYARIE